MALLATVTEQLFRADISAERFATLLSLIKDWRNSLKDKPYTQAIGACDLMISSSWPATLADA